MRITVEKKVPADLVEAFYGVYERAFDPLRTRAAARHLLTAEEFGAEMRDERIDKYVVWDDERPVGLTTLTTDLSAVQWISGDFFTARFPEQAARGAIYYLGYTLVHPDYEREGVTGRIIARLVQHMHRVAGVCAFDVAAYNDTEHGIGTKMAKISRWRPMDFRTVDRQSFYAAVFHGPDAPRVPRPRTGEPEPAAAAAPIATPSAATASAATAPAGAGSAAANGTRRRAEVASEKAVMRTVPLADRPDLAPAIPGILASRWPTFMLAGRPGHDVDLNRLLTAAAAHQILLLDADDEVAGVGLSVPLTWDRTVEGLPAGWDAAVTDSARLLDGGGTPTMVSALSVTLAPRAGGGGHAAEVVRALKAAALRAGAPGLLVPVRPVWKHRYPLIPLERYLGWRDAEGRVFDPWLRLHLGLGAQVLGVAEHSLTVTGTVPQWEEWTGRRLPDSGSYIIPGGLVPLEVDVAANRGTYREPNVWVVHPAA